MLDLGCELGVNAAPYLGTRVIFEMVYFYLTATRSWTFVCLDSGGSRGGRRGTLDLPTQAPPMAFQPAQV